MTAYLTSLTDPFYFHCLMQPDAVPVVSPRLEQQKADLIQVLRLSHNLLTNAGSMGNAGLAMDITAVQHRILKQLADIELANERFICRDPVSRTPKAKMARKKLRKFLGAASIIEHIGSLD